MDDRNRVQWDSSLAVRLRCIDEKGELCLQLERHVRNHLELLQTR